MKADAVVVGAGVAGLTCATLLADAGLRVSVLEQSHVPGGRARSWRDPHTGDTVDVGPHILLNHYSNIRALLARLGTAGEVCWQTEELLTVLDKGRRIHFRMARLPPPFHAVVNLPRILSSVPMRQLLSNLPLAWRTMRSSVADILALDDRTGLQHLLAMGVARDFVDWFWDSVAMALLNLPVARCSAASLMRLFLHMMAHNDVAFGFARVGLSDLYAWPAIRYVEDRGGEIRFDCPVVGLQYREGAVRGVCLGEGQYIDAPVVVALPPDGVEALLPTHHRLLPLLARFEPSPYVSCYLWFDRKLTTSRFWARPWSLREFNTDFYDLSNIRSGEAASRSLIASNIIWSHRVRDMDDAQIVRATLEEIAEFTSTARGARLVSASVHHIPMSVPCARPGIETHRPPVRQEPGLYLAGDWIDTGLPFCMESAARAGALAAEALLADRGAPRTLALPPPALHGLPRLIRKRDG